MRGQPWHYSDLELLREYYPAARWPAILRALPGRKRGNIQKKASALRLRRLRRPDTDLVANQVFAELRRVRESRGETREHLSLRLGYHKVSVGRWERGEAAPAE